MPHVATRKPAASKWRPTAGSPAARGFRMPAEWELQRGTWLSWPHRRATWPGPERYALIPPKFAEIVAVISRFQEVHINAAGRLAAQARRLCTAAGADMARVFLYDHPTDDSWCRDHGPIFLKHVNTGGLALTDWRFNAWGGKYPRYARDNTVPRRISRLLGIQRFARRMVLEGGSIDVNGEGLLLTTEACLLNPNRNPTLSRDRIEQALRNFLGVHEIVWLGDGIEGDDTDGHIDDLARFFKPDGIIAAVESNENDFNHHVLAENLQRLRALRTPAGRKFDIRELPMPEPCYVGHDRLAASYANFLILNGAVLVPTFRQPRRDAAALEILQDCFPRREIIGIDCLDVVVGGGTLHCLTQQQPA